MSSPMPLIHNELIRLTDLEPGLSLSGTPLTILDSGRAWHPKLTPYRLLSILLPVFLGTIKAVALQQGKRDEPITLEWISGVVVFIVLFNTGTYECRPIEHVPGYLAWLFKYDCMDAVWRLRSIVSQQVLTRPRYISNEIQVEQRDTIYMVTWYRLLVCTTVVSIGMLKAVLTYSGISTGATWVEWILGVVISSALYIIGLYESNTVGLWTSFFGTDRAYVVQHGQMVACLVLSCVLFPFGFMSLMLFLRRQLTYKYPDVYPSTQQPFLQQDDSRARIDSFISALWLAPFLFGGLWVSLGLIALRIYLGDHVRVPLHIRVFALWIVSFPSYVYTHPILPRPHSFTSALARLCAAIFSLIWTLRHLLCFLGASSLISRANDFLWVPQFQDLDKATNADDWLTFTNYAILDPLLYRNRTKLSTMIPVLAGVALMWSLLMMIKSAMETVPKIWRRTQREAVRAVLGLSGLSRVDDVHYSFVEFVWTLHGDGLEARVQ